MRNLRAKVQLWWHQRQLEALKMTLTRQGLWGPYYECLNELGSLISQHLEPSYTGVVLRSIETPLHSETIDLLTSDMLVMLSTIERGIYVDERLHYTAFTSRNLYAFLTHRDGYAVPVHDAFRIFHELACKLTQTLDTLLGDEDAETDRDYYRRRYSTVLNEIFAVYLMFVSLTHLHTA